MPKALPVIDISAPICCAPISASPPMSEGSAVELALRLKALADPARIRIVSILMNADDVRSGDLAAQLGLSEATISHHLSQLRKAGLVSSERRGMSVHSSANRDALDALRSVLNTCC
ncbi:putative ArsR family transcriptional regulator [Gordonia effusa NBRC 100432]|uniref:Putative ArsR family transcriptional regulator n=1 Tax=Gordonia effusa NBRC 100432 TaxID=1077974 RepID=H0R0X9_9ACTN|nr:Rv2640c family ArsR-like transcriptional regulator [Gordonia effusa]GAB18730.1 putative ArsR family transcriptional regulator [Gordonia effusa NBRC 100432]